ncbi:MAG: tRNA glutamyl-Q(34) synthetase GluQRS [Verrucomicrobiota bacterium]
MAVRTRFAPSPTGRLHLGHVYAAKVARDLARSCDGGEFFLRFEDIDRNRTRPEYYAEIEGDLCWLGLSWDGIPLRQTDRFPFYDEALDRLIADEFAYPCFCSRREILEEWERMQNAPHGPEGPLYPGTCRNSSPEERTRRIKAGESHAWRLDCQKAARQCGDLSFTDLRHGAIAVDPLLSGDVVLARKDIGTAYHLAVVVDDAFQQITHVTRGDDLLPATHIHRVLQRLLDLPEPLYLHHALVLDETGKRLAKRHDSLSVRTLRESGRTAIDVLLLAQPRVEKDRLR